MRNFLLTLVVGSLVLNVSLFGYTKIKTNSSGCGCGSAKAEAHPAPSGHLVYRGGPVISNVKIISVLWGPNVNPTVKNAMPTYLNALVTSAWIEGLCSYSTAGLPHRTTNQLIGNGQFIGQFEISPTIKGNAVTETEIQLELAFQITNGNLPKPQYDAQGYLESIYIIEFPPNLVITAQDGSVSCVDYCAFHSDMNYLGKPLMYAIHPDFSVGGCTFGCGSGSMLQNQQSVHSHELGEAITDPEVNVGTLAWYDNNNGEIGDICEETSSSGSYNEQAIVTLTVNGQPYTTTVQKLWSNVNRQCLGLIPFLASPTNFMGTVVKGKKTNENAHISSGNTTTHILTWTPSTDKTVTGYRIVQGGAVVAHVGANGPFTETFINRDPTKEYIYMLVAFNAAGEESPLVMVTLP